MTDNEKFEIVDGITALQRIKEDPEYWIRPVSWNKESFLVLLNDNKTFCARNTWVDGQQAVEDILYLLLNEQWILEPILEDGPPDEI
jgi:hypothetical protein